MIYPGDIAVHELCHRPGARIAISTRLDPLGVWVVVDQLTNDGELYTPLPVWVGEPAHVQIGTFTVPLPRQRRDP